MAGPGNDNVDGIFGSNESNEPNTNTKPGVTNIDPEGNKVTDVSSRFN